MKKHLIISVIALVITGSAFGYTERRAGGGVAGAGGAGGGGSRAAELPNSTEGMAKLGEALDLIHDIMERADKEAKAAHELEPKQSKQGADHPQCTKDPQPTIDSRGEAHDAHEVHDVHEHEVDIHVHESPAREPREGNAGKRN